MFQWARRAYVLGFIYYNTKFYPRHETMKNILELGVYYLTIYYHQTLSSLLYRNNFNIN